MKMKLSDIDESEIPTLADLEATFREMFTQVDEEELVELVMTLRVAASDEESKSAYATLAAQCACVLIKHFGVMEAKQ